MSTTLNNLIIGSLRLINVIKANESPSPDDMRISLEAFDAMLDSWSNDRLMVYTINQQIFNTIGGQAVYQMGPCQNILTFGNIVGGSFYANGVYVNVPVISNTGTGKDATAIVTVANNAVTTITISQNQSGPADLTEGGGYGYLVGDTITVSNTQLGGFGSGFTAKVATTTGGDWAIERPLRIEQAYVIWNDPMSAQALDLNMSNLTDSEWASIPIKNTPSNFPFSYYDNGNFPIKSISVWPVPTQSTGIRFWLRQPLVDFTNLNEIVQYPPGYERAFRFNLACELAAEFGKEIPPRIEQIAHESKGEIAKLNADPQYQTGDGGLSKGRRSFNYITGGFVAWPR